MRVFHLAFGLPIILAGCQASQQPKPKLAVPDTVTSPYVEFVGDQISLGMLAAAANPMWKCSSCTAQLSSTQALTGFKSVLALKPDIVHVMVGTYELGGGGNGGMETPVQLAQVPAANISTMVNMAKSAGVPVVVGILPPCPSIQGYDLSVALVNLYVSELGGPPTVEGVPVADYSTIGPEVGLGKPSPVCGADGFLPNQAGYGLMVTLAQMAFAPLHAGEVR